MSPLHGLGCTTGALYPDRDVAVNRRACQENDLSTAVTFWYYSPMRQRAFHIVSLFILVLFAAYSLSPKYYAFVGPTSSDAGRERSVVQGILWMAVVSDELLSSFGRRSPAPGNAVSAPTTDEDLFLIKKKRAMHRERFHAEPLLQAEDLPVRHWYVFRPLSEAYRIPHDRMHFRSDSHSPLNTGLSPPISLV